MALMIVTRPSCPWLKCTLGSFCSESLNQHPFGMMAKSIFFLRLDKDMDVPACCCRRTIGSLWYDLAWQRTIREATVCHSTEIEELISLHQSPAFYKYSKALCSLLFLSFLLLSLFSPSPLPSRSFCFVHFSPPTHSASHVFPLPSAPVGWCREMCLVCLRKRQECWSGGGTKPLIVSEPSDSPARNHI